MHRVTTIYPDSMNNGRWFKFIFNAMYVVKPYDGNRGYGLIILQSAYHCVRIKGGCGTGKNHFYIKLHVKIALGYTDYFSSECEVKKIKCFT